MMAPGGGTSIHSYEGVKTGNSKRQYSQVIIRTDFVVGATGASKYR